MIPTIRAVGPADLDDLLALHADHDPLFPIVAADVARERFDALLQHPGFTVFGAYIDDRLVGSCVLHILPDLTRGDASYALIDNVVAAIGERRQGHGQRLIRAASAAAVAAGYHRIMVMSRRRWRAPLLRQLQLRRF